MSVEGKFRMSRSVVIPALVLAAALGLVGCAGGAVEVPDGRQDGSHSAAPTDAAPRSAGNSAEVAAAIMQADAEMKLGFDFAALDGAAQWSAATYQAQGDGTRYMSLQAGRDQLDGVLAWVDAQDWNGWLIQDTEPGAEAVGRFRFLNDSSFTLQELLGDVQSVDVQFFDAE